jgi:WD40 repeat protein/DNA-binding SARP family transcriptional activator
MAALSLSLFGTFQASLGDEPLTQFRTNKVQALLIYLVTEAETAHQREALMTLLWPELPHRSGRTNLRQILYQLRKAIPELDNASGQGSLPFLLSERQTIRINPDVAIALDITTFEQQLSTVQTHQHSDLLYCSECQTRLETAVAVYDGVFLADFYLDDSNPFEEWAQARREAYQRQMLDALDTLAAMQVRAGDFAQAQVYARRQLEIDNLNERAVRQLMEALARNGQRSEALAAYDSCRQRLTDDLGMAPTARTAQLYQQILEDELGLATPLTPKVRGYELLEEIGEGAFGVVHRARQKVVGREVAIKIIKSQYANQPGFIRSFEAEAQTIARLEHPHIVPLYDFWREPDNAYLVMRWLRGGNLKTSLADGPWSLVTAVTLIDQIAAALHVIHSHGIIHRDIKPANILLDEERNAYLTDFGIAKDAKNNHLQTAVFKGSPAYVSPEQILNEAVTSLTDQYSLGIVLYELLTGQRPFTRQSLLKMMQQQINVPLPLVCEQMPDISPDVDTVLQKATAKKPHNRYPDILAFASAFRRAATNGGMLPAPPVEALGVDLPNPYKGLHAFQEADADLFFGRDEFVQQLVDHCAQSRFLAVVGPSGSGKSSAVKAGLLPALRAGAVPGSENWFFTEMAPGAYPLEELETALLPVAVNPPPNLLTPLEKDERGLGRVLKRILPVDKTAVSPNHLLLIIDQFEELFTLVPDKAKRDHFLQSLLSAINEPHSRLRVIITLRADFYDRPLQVPELGELLRAHTEVILPLSPTGLEEAITGPAAHVGAHFEPGLTATMAADVVDQPGALPLLQYALTELFERRDGRTLTHRVYREIGGVLGALARRAEELYLAFDENGREQTRQLFLRLVTLGEGTEDTRRRVLLSEVETLFADDGSQAISASQNTPFTVYGRYRLLTFDRDPASREPTVEVAHEALLREWPRLRTWLSDGRDDIRQQRLLAVAAAEWQTANRDESFLLRGSRLDQFRDWAENTTISLTQNEEAFLSASTALRLARQAEEEARRHRELETAQQLAAEQSRRAEEQTAAAANLRRRAVYLGVALVVAAFLAVAAIYATVQSRNNEMTAVTNAGRAATSEAREAEQRQLAEAQRDELATAEANAIAEREAAQAAEATAQAESWIRATAEVEAITKQELAEQQARLATSRELALAALNNLESDPELTMLLALQALETSYTKEAEEALHQGLQTSRILMTLPHPAPVWGAFYSPDGSKLATVADDLAVRIWSTETGGLLHTLPFDGIEYKGSTLMFSDSGEEVAMLAIGDAFESVILHIWDVESGELQQRQELPIRVESFSLDLSADWQYILAGREDGTVGLWGVEAAEKLHTFSENEELPNITFSPDGSQLMTTSWDGQVRIWDVASVVNDGQEQPTVSFKVPTDGIMHHANFSNDGSRLVIVFERDEGRVVELWDLAESSQPQLILPGHATVIQYMSFHPDDTYLATGSSDSTAKVWDLTTGQELFTLSGTKGFVPRLDFSPDGRHLATAGTDGTARIWNVQPEVPGEMMVIGDVPQAMDVDLSPDESKLALASFASPVTVWDMATGEHLLTLGDDVHPFVYRVAFQPDGSRLATVGSEGVVRIWDAETGEALLAFEAHIGGDSGGFLEGTVDISYSPDGRRLATAGADGLAKVWDAETGEELLTLAGHTAGLHSLTYSPDGRYIVTTSDSPDTTVKVWDAESGEEVHSFGPNPGRAVGLALSEDGRLLAAGGHNGFINVWDMMTGKLLVTMTGQSTTIGSLAFLPDGERLISGSGESTSIWDLATGAELVKLVPQPSWQIALSQDGRRVFVGTGEGTPGVRVYIVPLADAVALAQARITRTLTEGECRQYLHLEVCPGGE